MLLYCIFVPYDIIVRTRGDISFILHHPLKVVSIADYSYGSKHRRLVVSHKWAVAQQLQTGDVVYDGIVTAITSYGASIPFQHGRMQGLLHKNNISQNDWKLVRTKNEE